MRIELATVGIPQKIRKIFKRVKTKGWFLESPGVLLGPKIHFW